MDGLKAEVNDSHEVPQSRCLDSKLSALSLTSFMYACVCRNIRVSTREQAYICIYLFIYENVGIFKNTLSFLRTFVVCSI